MVLTRTKKESVVSDLAQALKNMTIGVFVNFHGLSVAQSTKLRRELRAVRARYMVTKKTLLQRAFDNVGIPGAPKLVGEVGIVIGTGDVTEPPQVIARFIKEAKEGLAILGGVYESKFVEADIIKRLASIPSRETLLTQLAVTLSHTMASFARALEEVRKKSTQ